jgi:hypothetical protein
MSSWECDKLTMAVGCEVGELERTIAYCVNDSPSS